MFGTNANIAMASLQIRSTLIRPWLPSPVRLVFNRPTRGIQPKFIAHLVLFDNDASNLTVLLEGQILTSHDIDTHKIFSFHLQGQL